jgi:acetyl-CoA carboxylase biotin carboxyl carrier protein
MKIMNEIESEVSGVIREIAVENAQPVEFGQILFRVDPHA